MILLGFFGTGATVAGLIAIVIGTVLAAPHAPQSAEPGRSWWAMLAVGAALSLLAALVSLGAETVGGLLTVLGGILVALGVGLGWPGQAG